MSLDDRLRRGLPRIADEERPDMDGALDEAVRRGRRRRILSRTGAVLAAVAVAAVAVVAVPRVMEAVGQRTVGLGAPSPEATPAVCGGILPFQPTHLPEGFVSEPVPGPAPGAPPADRGQAVWHWTDGTRAVEARNPGTVFVELAQEEDARTITVLGQETSSFGPVAPNYESPGDEEFIVQFTLGEMQGDRYRCDLWSLDGRGLSLEELLRVAEGLALSTG